MTHGGMETPMSGGATPLTDLKSIGVAAPSQMLPPHPLPDSVCPALSMRAEISRDQPTRAEINRDQLRLAPFRSVNGCCRCVTGGARLIVLTILTLLACRRGPRGRAVCEARPDVGFGGGADGG